MPPPIFLSDPGLGTTLEDDYAINPFPSPQTPLWSSYFLVTQTQTLLSCHKYFVATGSQILSTATYQVSARTFAQTKTEEYPDGIPKEAIARYLQQAIWQPTSAHSDSTIAGEGPKGKVALSLGPYGATMTPSCEYTGAYDAKHSSIPALEQWYRERLSLFRQPEDLLKEVHFVAFETLPRKDEITAIRRMWNESVSGVLWWTSVLYPRVNEDGEPVMPDGKTAAEAVRAMLLREEIEVGEPVGRPWGVGINCTSISMMKGIVESYERTVREMLERGEIEEWPALVLYPAGTHGGVYDPVEEKWKPQEEGMEGPCWDEELASIALTQQQRSNWKCIILGGCCKSNAKDIEKLKGRLSINSLEELDAMCKYATLGPSRPPRRAISYSEDL